MKPDLGLTNSWKCAFSAALCAAVLTIATVTPGFAASGFGSDMQGRVPEVSPGLPTCPDCIGIGVKPVHKILPDTIMEPITWEKE